MSQPHNARTLPALRHTAPAAFAREAKRGQRSHAKNPFSLDGLLRTLPPRPAAASTVSDAVTGPGAQPAFLTEAPSPAEALLATACARGVAPTPAAAQPVASSSPTSTETWRSQLLLCEMELRELVTLGVREPPTLQRTLKAVDLFDRVGTIVQDQAAAPFVGDLLRLFRVEFCRSIFAANPDDGVVDDGGEAAAVQRSGADGLSSAHGARAHRSEGTPALADGRLTRTYFDEAESLRRAKAYLTTALSKGASGESLLLLQRRLEEKDEQLTWYESELERLRRQHEQVSEECRRLRQKNEADAQEAASIQRQLQRDVQTLHVENKDVQLQLFRLRKQMAGGKSNQLKEGYRQMKLSKMAQTQSLFDEGDERVVLLVLLGQVESRVNEVLDAYDNDYVLTPEASRRELRTRMADQVVVLLEDMHFCEASYRRLVDARRGGGRNRHASALGGALAASPTLQQLPLELVHSGKDEEAPDETDGFVGILFDQRVYEHFQARHATQARLQQFEEAANTNRSSSIGRGSRRGPTAVPSSRLMSPEMTSPLRHNDTLADLRLRQAEDEDVPQLLHTGNESRHAQRAAAEQAMTIIRSPVDSLDSREYWPGDSMPLPNASSGGRLLSLYPPAALQQPPSTVASASPGREPSGILSASGSGGVGGRLGPGAAVGSGHAATSRSSSSSVFERSRRAHKAQWVNNIVGAASTAVAFTVPRPNSEQADVVLVEKRVAEVATADVVMHRVLRRPMQDLSSDKFLSTVEVFTGEDPVQQRLLCRVNYVDPSLPIQVPDATNFVKIKYAHSETVRQQTAAAMAAAQAAPLSTTAPATARGSVVSAGTRESRTGESGGAGAADANVGVYRGNPSLRLFKQLGSKSLVENNPGLQYRAGAVSSTTASTVAFQRLNPMSPNRAPEWLLYQQLFGAFRSLTPRMIEVTTIDHVMACASERFFIRMEYRYDECIARAAQQCANLQLRQDMAERLFKDMYVLSDFQEALVDELEARYGYPELVAKTLYEILCYLDAVADKDSVLSAYLDVIRGFSSPTQVHFISYMLYHLSYCWPSADPTLAVSVEDVRTVLDYLYRNTSAMIPIDLDGILKDYDMASRSAPLTFVSVRQFLASAMVHLEEPLLLHLHGRFHAQTQRAASEEISWDTYESVIAKCGRMKEERRSLVRFLSSGLGVNRPTFASLQQLTFLAASAWSSNLWE